METQPEPREGVWSSKLFLAVVCRVLVGSSLHYTEEQLETAWVPGTPSYNPSLPAPLFPTPLPA